MERVSRSQAGVLITSVCAGTLPNRSCLCIYIYLYTKRGEGSLKLWGSEWKGEGGEDEKEEKRWGEGTRSMRGLALHWHAACSTYTSPYRVFLLLLLLLLLSSFLTPKFLHSNGQEYRILAPMELDRKSYPFNVQVRRWLV